jgi:hypothetical protein
MEYHLSEKGKQDKEDAARKHAEWLRGKLKKPNQVQLQEDIIEAKYNDSPSKPINLKISERKFKIKDLERIRKALSKNILITDDYSEKIQMNNPNPSHGIVATKLHMR